MNNCETLVDQIKSSVLTIGLKCSAFNNLVLAKIIHHFYDARSSEICIESMESIKFQHLEIC